MSYKLRFYKCPKSVAEQYKNLTDNDFESDENLNYPNNTGIVEEMWYDCTMWLYFDEFRELCRNKQEEKIWSRLFNNKLECECELSFNTMNKEQFKNFINMIRRHISDLYKRDCLDLKGVFELADLITGKIKYEDLEDRYADRNCDFSKVNAVEMARRNAIDANFDSDIYRIYYGSDEDFNRHLDEEKYKISFGSSWRDTLNNAIFVYKTFDWENNIILICGG